MQTLYEAIVEVRRERLVRLRVYPKLVDAGKLSQAEADRRAAALGWAQAYLEKVARDPDIKSLVFGADAEPLHFPGPSVLVGSPLNSQAYE